MAKGAEILLEANPKGKFEEGVISGAIYPGQFVEPEARSQSSSDTLTYQGRFKYRARGGAAGAAGPVCIVLPDREQGKLATDAYADGDRVFLYWPVAGEEMNVLIVDGPGTNNVVGIGDKLGIEIHGKASVNEGYTSTPFRALESVTLTADTLTWAKFVGGQA